MADDLGYGDVHYNGNPVVKTPNLDNMAAKGIRFDRFYAAAPVCSPTRASCLTGRHPYRLNIPWAGRHPMPKEEITIAEALKTKGYVTGHFGKWHVGGLSKTVKQSEFPNGPSPYSPPWENGFDECYSTESMMPLYNPYYMVGGAFGTKEYRYVQDVPVAFGQRTGGFVWTDRYWTGPGKFDDTWLAGDDSKIIMDKALDFINRNTKQQKPFFAVIWFHTPHTPVVAGNEYRALYPDQTIPAQHWLGCITAMDEQIGRLNHELNILNIYKNTLVWFCSDNGPSYIHDYNSAGPLRGKKAELLEGGIRVPAFLVWPAIFPEHKVIKTAVSTSDFYPTLLSVTHITMPGQLPLDGENVIPVIQDNKPRKKNIGFISPLPSRLKKQVTVNEEQMALEGRRYKLISMDNGRSFQLYDLTDDIDEIHDLSAEKPEIVESMKKELFEWIRSCKKEREKYK
ncbi:MAG: sulfatase-like hydrolase/transferase [Bacteroidales bacterium]|nr:sulfatase-like hydrolase/transferase [Bacteroidales bacterium]